MWCGQWGSHYIWRMNDCHSTEKHSRFKGDRKMKAAQVQVHGISPLAVQCVACFVEVSKAESDGIKSFVPGEVAVWGYHCTAPLQVCRCWPFWQGRWESFENVLQWRLLRTLCRLEKFGSLWLEVLIIHMIRLSWICGMGWRWSCCHYYLFVLFMITREKDLTAQRQSCNYFLANLS